MTISLTDEEIEAFATHLEQWNDDCLRYILTHYSSVGMYDARPTDQLLKLRERFEKENPRPHWSTFFLT